MLLTRNCLSIIAACAVSVALSSAVRAQAPTSSEIARWEQQASNITITRDRWGIAHVHGKSDADAFYPDEIKANAEREYHPGQ